MNGFPVVLLSIYQKSKRAPRCGHSGEYQVYESRVEYHFWQGHASSSHFYGVDLVYLRFPRIIWCGLYWVVFGNVDC
jgi:hypothetical protein